MLLRVNQILENSRVQGPGERFTVWVQGCTLHCEGCINQDTWAFDTGMLYSTDDLSKQILESKSQGLTITGGEPLDQIDSVFDLCSKIFPYKNIFLCSGYSYEIIKRDSDKRRILTAIDLLCSGPFDYKQVCKSQWKGSNNQEIIYFTDRGKKLLDLPILKREYRIDKKTGKTLVTGFSI
jgi:anaerobic ribonucleoside-triphosphate reductase activating protein